MAVKKIFFGIFFILLLGLGGITIYLMNSDWGGQHKDKIIEQFHNSTGKVLRFDGSLDFRFLPSPHLHANNVKIFNNESSLDTALAEIRNLDIELALKPLIGGEFDITKMEISGVTFNIDWDKGFSWQDDLSADQRQQMEETRLSLNSALIKDAELNFESASNNIAFHLNNLNGEISAESMLGPFHMEGNYINGTSPEGFAMTIGRLSETSATPANLAITHPSSNSYIRFDGSFQNTNKVINGNIIIESDNISKFAKANFDSFQIPEEYNQKSALGFDLSLNSQNIALSNIVVKYGENTSGSGSIQMPRTGENAVITTSFNFADINLDNFTGLIKDAITKLQEFKEMPKYNIAGEIKALRLHYQGQQIRNAAINFEYNEKLLNLKSAEVLLPGNTSMTLAGEIFPLEGALHYKGSTNVRTDNLMQLLKWLKIDPQQITPSVYKNLVLDAKFSGNLNRIQVAPFKLTLDKSTISGEAGLILGDRKDMIIIAQADTINFDNYITPLPDEIKKKSWLERILYRFNQTQLLNDIDLVVDSKADLIIYESMPFEKVALKGNILNKAAEIENLSIDKIANTKVTLQGKLSGFGNTPQLENFNYNINCNDITSLINKLELKVPNLDYKRFNHLTAVGNINGSMSESGINTNISIGNLQAEYAGKITHTENATNLDGKLVLKHPNFNNFLSNIQSPYEPNGENLGLLQFSANIKGNSDAFDITDIDLNIGQVNAQGNLSYEKNNGQSYFTAQVKSNHLDVSKFLQKSKSSAITKGTSSGGASAFLARPNTSEAIFDYTPYTSGNLKADIDINELILQNWLLKEAKFNLEKLNSTLSVKDFTGTYNNTPIKSEIVINMDNSPTLTWNGSIKDAPLNNFEFAGKTYGLRDGTFSSSWNLSSSAESLAKFWSNLKGSAELRATSPVVLGIDTATIYNDLLKRENNDGLSEKVRGSLKSGNSQFKEFIGHLNISDGKFSLADTTLSGDNLKIKIYGDGNLTDWTMNTIFNAKFDEPQYLPEFSFILKDSIADPTVDVNVDSLVKFYKSKVEMKEAEAIKIVEDEKNQRVDAWNEQKKISDELIADARNVLEKDIDAKIQTAFSEKSTVRYSALKQELANVLASLAEKMSAFDIENLQDADIIKADEINKSYKQSIQDMSAKVNEIYADDVKIQLESYTNQITEEYNLLKQLIFSYNSSLEKYRERLADIKTSYSLNEDSEFQHRKDEISTKIAFLEKLNNDAAVIKNNIPSIPAANYEKVNTELNDILSKMQEGRDELRNTIDAFDKMETQKIDEVINIYRDQIEKEENSRLIKENTGSISIKKTGQTVKVSRDLEEIKNASKDINQEKVRVLDFTKQKIDTEPEPQPKVGVVKKGSNRIAN